MLKSILGNNKLWIAGLGLWAYFDLLPSTFQHADRVATDRLLSTFETSAQGSFSLKVILPETRDIEGNEVCPKHLHCVNLKFYPSYARGQNRINVQGNDIFSYSLTYAFNVSNGITHTEFLSADADVFYPEMKRTVIQDLEDLRIRIDTTQYREYLCKVLQGNVNAFVPLQENTYDVLDRIRRISGDYCKGWQFS